MKHIRSFPLPLGTATLSLLVFALPDPALAAGSGMPWEAPLQTILESIEGPVAKIVAVIIIIVTGLTLAHHDPDRRGLAGAR